MDGRRAVASRRLRRGRVAGCVAAVAAIVGLSACGGESEFSQLAQRGKDTALSNGCASCHGSQGQGGVGPSWIDLAGSDVELKDGSVVVADDAYLLRSILDPRAEEAAGFTLAMPVNGLSEAQAADIVAYIKELTSDDN